MSKTTRYGSEYAPQTHARGCKIRRTFNSYASAYPEATTPTVARMVARRMGVNVTTVLRSL